MEISSNSDKRAFICRAFASQVDKTQYVDYPGNKCVVTGDFSEVKFSDVSFTESEPLNGEPVEQNLQFIFRGQSYDSDVTSKLLTNNLNIIKLHYSNGDVKIVGTKDNPVILSPSKSGRVVELTLESKRFCAEQAKYLINI
jgi:hypothetical protein